MSEEKRPYETPRLFAWACCDCSSAEKATIPLHNKDTEGKRIIQALCLDCLRKRIQHRKEEAHQS